MKIYNPNISNIKIKPLDSLPESNPNFSYGKIMNILDKSFIFGLKRGWLGLSVGPTGGTGDPGSQGVVGETGGTGNIGNPGRTGHTGSGSTQCCYSVINSSPNDRYIVYEENIINYNVNHNLDSPFILINIYDSWYSPFYLNYNDVQLVDNHNAVLKDLTFYSQDAEVVVSNIDCASFVYIERFYSHIWTCSFNYDEFFTPDKTCSPSPDAIYKMDVTGEFYDKIVINCFDIFGRSISPLKIDIINNHLTLTFDNKYKGYITINPSITDNCNTCIKPYYIKNKTILQFKQINNQHKWDIVHNLNTQAIKIKVWSDDILSFIDLLDLSLFTFPNNLTQDYTNPNRVFYQLDIIDNYSIRVTLLRQEDHVFLIPWSSSGYVEIECDIPQSQSLINTNDSTKDLYTNTFAFSNSYWSIHHGLNSNDLIFSPSTDNTTVEFYVKSVTCNLSLIYFFKHRTDLVESDSIDDTIPCSDPNIVYIKTAGSISVSRNDLLDHDIVPISLFDPDDTPIDVDGTGTLLASRSYNIISNPFDNRINDPYTKYNYSHRLPIPTVLIPKVYYTPAKLDYNPLTPFSDTNLTVDEFSYKYQLYYFNYEVNYIDPHLPMPLIFTDDIEVNNKYSLMNRYVALDRLIKFELDVVNDSSNFILYRPARTYIGLGKYSTQALIVERNKYILPLNNKYNHLYTHYIIKPKYLWEINHNLNTTNIRIECFNQYNNPIIPKNILVINKDQIILYFHCDTNPDKLILQNGICHIFSSTMDIDYSVTRLLLHHYTSKYWVINLSSLISSKDEYRYYLSDYFGPDLTPEEVLQLKLEYLYDIYNRLDIKCFDRIGNPIPNYDLLFSRDCLVITHKNQNGNPFATSDSHIKFDLDNLIGSVKLLWKKPTVIIDDSYSYIDKMPSLVIGLGLTNKVRPVIIPIVYSDSGTYDIFMDIYSVKYDSSIFTTPPKLVSDWFDFRTVPPVDPAETPMIDISHSPVIVPNILDESNLIECSFQIYNQKIFPNSEYHEDILPLNKERCDSKIFYLVFETTVTPLNEFYTILNHSISYTSELLDPNINEITIPEFTYINDIFYYNYHIYLSHYYSYNYDSEHYNKQYYDSHVKIDNQYFLITPEEEIVIEKLNYIPPDNIIFNPYIKLKNIISYAGQDFSLPINIYDAHSVNIETITLKITSPYLFPNVETISYGNDYNLVSFRPDRNTLVIKANSIYSHSANLLFCKINFYVLKYHGESDNIITVECNIKVRNQPSIDLVPVISKVHIVLIEEISGSLEPIPIPFPHVVPNEEFIEYPLLDVMGSHGYTDIFSEDVWLDEENDIISGMYSIIDNSFNIDGPNLESESVAILDTYPILSKDSIKFGTSVVNAITKPTDKLAFGAYIHSRKNGTKTWYIEHYFDSYDLYISPIISLSGKKYVPNKITYIDTTRLELHFDEPVSGKVYIYDHMPTFEPSNPFQDPVYTEYGNCNCRNMYILKVTNKTSRFTITHNLDSIDLDTMVVPDDSVDIDQFNNHTLLLGYITPQKIKVELITYNPNASNISIPFRFSGTIYIIDKSGYKTNYIPTNYIDTYTYSVPLGMGVRGESPPYAINEAGDVIDISSNLSLIEKYEPNVFYDSCTWDIHHNLNTTSIVIRTYGYSTATLDDYLLSPAFDTTYPPPLTLNPRTIKFIDNNSIQIIFDKPERGFCKISTVSTEQDKTNIFCSLYNENKNCACKNSKSRDTCTTYADYNILGEDSATNTSAIYYESAEWITLRHNMNFNPKLIFYNEQNLRVHPLKIYYVNLQYLEVQFDVNHKFTGIMRVCCLEYRRTLYCEEYLSGTGGTGGVGVTTGGTGDIGSTIGTTGGTGYWPIITGGTGCTGTLGGTGLVLPPNPNFIKCPDIYNQNYNPIQIGFAEFSLVVTTWHPDMTLRNPSDISTSYARTMSFINIHNSIPTVSRLIPWNNDSESFPFIPNSNDRRYLPYEYILEHLHTDNDYWHSTSFLRNYSNFKFTSQSYEFFWCFPTISKFTPTVIGRTISVRGSIIDSGLCLSFTENTGAPVNLRTVMRYEYEEIRVKVIYGYRRK